ncbi:MAG: hydrogenase maturation protease [Bryobacteraceae bacterium]
MATRKRLAVIGIGNTIAGDDGVGIEVVRLLREIWSGDERILLHTLEGDLFAVADLLPAAEKLLFIDAVAGEQPGLIVTGKACSRSYAPSFHQTDIGTVMESLKVLGMADPFPEWEIWGITILPPRELKSELSPAVRAAAATLVERLVSLHERTVC